MGQERRGKKQMPSDLEKYLKHPDKLGEGAKKRRHLGKKMNAKAIGAEFKRGTLHSGSGDIVKNPAQMRAIIASTNKGRR